MNNNQYKVVQLRFLINSNTICRCQLPSSSSYIHLNIFFSFKCPHPILLSRAPSSTNSVMKKQKKRKKKWKHFSRSTSIIVVAHKVFPFTRETQYIFAGPGRS